MPAISRSQERSADASVHAEALARRHLRYGTRSVAEFRAYLRQRQIPDATIRRLIRTHEQQGHLDDRACAKLVAIRLADRGYARAAIAGRLAAKGLADGLVETALDQIADDDAERARQLVEQRARRSDVRDPRARGRVLRLLARRGFDADVIEHVMSGAEPEGAASDD